MCFEIRFKYKSQKHLKRVLNWFKDNEHVKAEQDTYIIIIINNNINKSNVYFVMHKKPS